MSEKKKDNKFMESLATFIVDKRKAFYLLFIVLIVYSIFSIGKVQVNNDITSYLPPESETRVGLTLMDEQFSTFATAKVMVSNTTVDLALDIQKDLEQIKGISKVEFADDDGHFKGSDALFNITFDGEVDDNVSKTAFSQLKEYIKDFDYSISSELGQDTAASLAKDMNVILLIAAVIIVAVLLLTSKTYMEVPVMIITFGVAALLNKGTNYWFGEISFVTNSIAVVLQLALAIDYAIILCHRFMEEHDTKDVRESAIAALSKAIPEISSSSLTTVSGMVALMFMQFRIGMDMGIILTKSILFSLFTVFLLMPGLLVMFAKYIDKTHHKSFVPKIDFVGEFAYKTRIYMPLIFVVVLVMSFVFQGKCNYIYDVASINSSKKTQNKIELERIEGVFGSTNQLAVLVPTGNYEKEKLLLSSLSKLEKVKSTLGLGNVKINDQFVLTDRVSPRQFSELADLDVEAAKILFSGYAIEQGKYGVIVGGIDKFQVPIIDIFMFLYNQKEEGYVTLDHDLNQKINDLYKELSEAKVQLKGEKYSRFLLDLDLPIEGEETFNYLGEIRNVVDQYYDEHYLVGNTTSDFDLQTSFVSDNVIITILTALFVMIILLFTFQSAGLPVLLVLAIQGSIWINFSYPYLTGDSMFFLSYLIVSAIQMGATIDYAIVITSRYMELKQQMPLKEAIIESLNQVFPTIFTSGSILVSAGFLIGILSSDPTVASIGVALGRGTLVSILIVLGVLPQILLFGDFIIMKSAFTLKRDLSKPVSSGNVKVEGRFKGYVNGMIDANISGTITGEINGDISSKNGIVDQIEDKE
ncbi:MAG: MMPL family transporter [Erysipelotrichaceae bacterium]